MYELILVSFDFRSSIWVQQPMNLLLNHVQMFRGKIIPADVTNRFRRQHLPVHVFHQLDEATVHDMTGELLSVVPWSVTGHNRMSAIAALKAIDRRRNAGYGLNGCTGLLWHVIMNVHFAEGSYNITLHQRQCTQAAVVSTQMVTDSVQVARDHHMMGSAN